MGIESIGDKLRDIERRENTLKHRAMHASMLHDYICIIDFDCFHNDFPTKNYPKNEEMENLPSSPKESTTMTAIFTSCF